jgi:hypothetical protein
MQDNVLVNLSAPTSGPLKGILFFQDRSISGTRQNVFGGGASGRLEGAIYFRTQEVMWSNQQSDSVAYTIIVSDTLGVSINVTKVRNDYSSLVDGSPIRRAVLAE